MVEPNPTQSETGAQHSRHAARALQTSHQAARVIRDLTGLEDDDSALAALGVVAGAIVRRISATEANDFISQLPSELHDVLLDLPAGPDRNVTAETVHVELAERLSIDLERARAVQRGVWAWRSAAW